MGFFLLAAFLLACADQRPSGPAERPSAPEEAKPPESQSQEQDARTAAQRRRIEMNLLGAADTEGGEGRRNENVQFNLVDNNALKELNIRLGVTATIIQEFRADKGYFGAEFGNIPAPTPHLGAPGRRGLHGGLRWRHQSSVTSARSFFQAGPVQPAHENEYGFSAGADLSDTWHLGLDGTQQKIRGQVNGNVLVPKPDERTALSTDPAVRALITRWMSAFPLELPNRTDVNIRALNTNAPQSIDSNFAGARLDGVWGRDRVGLLYSFNSQNVDAFQLIAGQNPDTRLANNRARITWAHAWSASTTSQLSAGFDRLRAILQPEPNAIGPMVSVSGLTTLGPDAIIPINRAQNLFRYAGEMRQLRGRHSWYSGFDVLRRQFNGSETDAHRGYFSFGNDFGTDSITNFRLGLPTQHIVSIGDIHRGFRNWDLVFFGGDVFKATSALTLSYSLRFQPVTRPHEVNHLDTIPYPCDCNNLAPSAGFAARLPGTWGVLRGNAGVQYGEIFPITFSQVRFSPPGSVKLIVPVPDLLHPLNNLADAKGTLYLLDPSLRTPYAYQYNFSWQPQLSKHWRLELGYVGSRSHKLFNMWYENRAGVVPGIEQITKTINQRRPDPQHADYRRVLNASRGYFDAARVSLVLPKWRAVTIDAGYWFSKAMDLGSAYTNTAYDADSRLSRSQSVSDTHSDMKGLSTFDQPHAFLGRVTLSTPTRPGTGWLSRIWRGWDFSSFVLMKTGTPFTVVTGADGPGYGNVDGNGGDRPNVVDTRVLGRTIGNPDTSRQLLPRSAFTYMKATDDRGNLGRDTFRKGGIRNVNAALARTWLVGPERRLILRAESVNLTNTPQFAEPGLELANQNFGQITNTLNDGRTFRVQLQFAW